jgi:hypothetical protein
MNGTLKLNSASKAQTPRRMLFPIPAGKRSLPVASPLVRGIATVAGNICQDVRCWYYRYPNAGGGAFQSKRKGGATCYAIHGENK